MVPTAHRLALTVAALLVPSMLAAPAQGGALPGPTVGGAQVFSKYAFGQDLVVDREGGATIVWTRSVARPVVLAAHREAGGAWSAWTRLGRGLGPQVGVDAAGSVTAAWRTPHNGLDSARLRADGAWTEPTHVAARDSHVLGFDLAVAADGSAAMAWTHRTAAPDAPRQISWVHRPKGGAWTAPVAVTKAGHATRPLLALSHDLATMVFGVQRMGHPQRILTRSKAAGKPWTKSHVLTRSGSSIDLAVDRAGGAMMLFEPGSRATLKAVTRPPAGQWGTPFRLSPAGVHVHRYALEMNADGAAVVAWVRGQGGVDAMTKPPDGPWSASTRLSDPGTQSSMVAVSINQHGDSLATWGYFGLQAADHLAAGTWSGAAVVHPARDQVLEVALSATGPGGDSLVLYKHEDSALRVRDVTP